VAFKEALLGQAWPCKQFGCATNVRPLFVGYAPRLPVSNAQSACHLSRYSIWGPERPFRRSRSQRRFREHLCQQAESKPPDTDAHRQLSAAWI